MSRSEKEHLVLDNQKLVHYLVLKLGITPYASEYEDIVSIGTIGLIKAATTFDLSKKSSFSTYASRCIYNKIFMYYRKANKYTKDVSIDKPIENTREGKEITLGDTIEHPESDFVEKIENKESFIQLVSIILNYLKGRERIGMLYYIGEVLQKDIAKKINVARTYVPTILTKAIIKMRDVANNNVHYKEVFSMAVVGDEYKISFSSKDISQFNKIFATLLQNLTSTEKLPDFRVNCNGERIVVQIPAHPESFSFVAQIIQEIDEYSMTFISDKRTLPKDNTVLQEVKSDDKGKNNDTVEADSQVKQVKDGMTSTCKEITQTNKSNIMESNIDKTKSSNSKRVKEFILTLDEFNTKQVISNFPDVPSSTVYTVIKNAKIKGLITQVAWGCYIVNKS